jgi:hypothetical protein
MRCVKSPQRFGFVVGDIDSCDPLSKDVPAHSARIDRGELVDQKFSCRHELERLERDSASRYFDDVRRRFPVAVVPLPVL